MVVGIEASGLGAGGASGPGMLGILACSGPLPIEVAEAAIASGRLVHIVAIEGFAGPEVDRFPHERVSLGEVGRMLASFERAGAREIVIAGAMTRPNLLTLRVDWGLVRNLPTVLSMTKGGDDSVLRRVIRFFEGQGLTVVGAAEVAPALLASGGSIGSLAPRADQAAALGRASRLIGVLGRFDIGQAVVATADRIIAVEGVRGTDAMLGDLGPDGFAAGLGATGVLAKLPKPGQEMRIDLPAIGVETVRRAAAAGLAGIGVAAGGAIVLGRPNVARLADEAGLFVMGLETWRAAPPEEEIGPPDGFERDQAGKTQPLALQVLSRRAPTPADRRDISIGRQLMAALGAHAAGCAAIVVREHVLGISGALPLPAFVEAQGRPASWGRRAFKRQIGVLVIDDGAARDQPEGSDGGRLLDEALFRAARSAGLAVIVHLGPIGIGAARDERVAWANDVGLCLLAPEAPS